LTDRWTDRQNLDNNTVRMLRCRTVKIIGKRTKAQFTRLIDGQADGRTDRCS